MCSVVPPVQNVFIGMYCMWKNNLSLWKKCTLSCLVNFSYLIRKNFGSSKNYVTAKGRVGQWFCYMSLRLFWGGEGILKKSYVSAKGNKFKNLKGISSLVSLKSLVRCKTIKIKSLDQSTPVKTAKNLLTFYMSLMSCLWGIKYPVSKIAAYCKR